MPPVVVLQLQLWLWKTGEAVASSWIADIVAVADAADDAGTVAVVAEEVEESTE
jgi:hypothetical protein